MAVISDLTSTIGVAVGKIALCYILPKTANLLFGNREILLMQSLEQDLNAQNIAVKIPLFAGCALGLFHTEVVSIITGARDYAEKVIDTYYEHPKAAESIEQPEPMQSESHKELNIHLYHNTSYEELICECRAPDGMHADFNL